MSAPTSITITIRLFASIADGLRSASGVGHSLRLPRDNGVDALWTAVAAEFDVEEATLAPWRTRVAIAVNDRLVGADVVFADGDEVALLPPVSGG